MTSDFAREQQHRGTPLGQPSSAQDASRWDQSEETSPRRPQESPPTRDGHHRSTSWRSNSSQASTTTLPSASETVRGHSPWRSSRQTLDAFSDSSMEDPEKT